MRINVDNVTLFTTAERFYVLLGIFNLAFKALFTHGHAEVAPEKLLKLVFDPAPNQIFLGKPLTVKCERTAGAVAHDGASIFLHCPIAPWNSFCFQNCISACAGEEPGRCPYEAQLSHVTCRTVVTHDGHVTNEYTVEKATKEWLGVQSDGKPGNKGFYCKTAGLQTPEVWLSATSTHVPTLTAGDASLTILPTPNPPKENNILISTVSKLASKGSGKTGIETQPDNLGIRTSAILRECLVILAIVIVFLSLSTNVFCCIRCALIRQYSKNKAKVRMQNLFCMAEEIGCARSGLRPTDGSWSTKYTPSHAGLCLLKADPNGFTSDTGQLHPLTEYPAYYVPANILKNSGGHPVAFTDTRSNTASRSEFCDGNATESVTTVPIMTGSTQFGTPNPSLHYEVRYKQSKRSSILTSTGSVELQQIASQSHLAAAVAAYCAQQRQNLNELQQQLQMDELSMQSPQTASDGICSCPGSIGNPESSMLDPQPPSSLGIGNLHKNSAEKQQVLPGLRRTNTENGGQITRTPSDGATAFGLYPLPSRQCLQAIGQPNIIATSERSSSMTENTALLHYTRDFQLPSSNFYLPVTQTTSVSPSDSGTGTGSGEQITTEQTLAPATRNDAILNEVTRSLLNNRTDVEPSF